jgi:hypothetical protein
MWHKTLSRLGDCLNPTLTMFGMICFRYRTLVIVHPPVTRQHCNEDICTMTNADSFVLRCEIVRPMIDLSSTLPGSA